MKNTVISEGALLKWLGITPYKLKTLISLGMPFIPINRELLFYVKQDVTQWLLQYRVKLDTD